MERRNFLKNMFGLAISLFPATTIIEKIFTTIAWPAEPITIAAMAPASGIAIPRPFIITVSNPTPSPIYNFDTLGSFQYLGSSGFSSDNKLSINNGHVESDNDETYKEVLVSLMTNPIAVSQVVLLSENKDQMEAGFNIVTHDANGYVVIKPVRGYVAHTHLTTRFYQSKPVFRVDGFTKMQFHTVFPETKMKIMMYPQTTINLAGLSNSNIINQ